MNFLKTIGYVALALISVVYLLNPGAGVFEILPDNIPFIGNLDEVGALLMLLKCLQHFGIGSKGSEQRREVPNDAGTQK
ncbi:MAG: hypothetical protein AB8C95_08570 [Phycisphaeraceae bacterium]